MQDSGERKVYTPPVLETLNVLETRAGVSGGASVGVSVGVNLGS